MGEIIQANCSCGEPINIEIGARLSARADRKRPFYPDEDHCKEWGLDENQYPLDGVTSFSCRNCGGYLANTVPGAEFEQTKEPAYD